MTEPPPSSETGAGAEALLGLAAGETRPRLPSLSRADTKRAGPEPPPLQLPTQQSSHPPPSLLPTAPSLSLPHAQSTLLRNSLPPAHELRQRAFQAQSRHDLPSMGEWAPPEHSFAPILAPATSYDPLHPPRLNPLQQSVLPTSANHVPPWEPGRTLSGTGGLSAVRAEYALPAPSAHWPPPSHFAFAQAHHISAGGYLYYPSIGQHDSAQQSLQSQQPQQVQGQGVAQIPHYSVTSAVRQPIISPVPPPLELPLPVRRSGEPPPALDAKVPSVHELPRLKDTLPGIDSKIPSLKDSLAMRAQKRAVLSDHAVSKVPDIMPPFGNALSEGNQSCITNVLAPSQLSEHVELDKDRPEEVKREKECKSPQVKRGRGIADLMNPTDTSPGQSSGPDPLTLDMKDAARKNDLTPKKAAVLTDSGKEAKADELATINREEVVDRTEEPRVTSVSVVSSSQEEEGRNTSSFCTIKKSEGKIRTQDVRCDEKRGETSSEEAENPAEAKFEAEAEEDEEIEETEDGEKYEDSEETRCPCGSVENSGFMIACDECNTWQHGRCMGYRGKSEVPEKYYCNICRPEEMRPTCLAYRKYKERQLLKDKDSKDTKRDPETLLAVVKPLELRRHFIADMKQKKNGQKLSKCDFFHRYATLLRNQFAKHKQSTVEGLVILLDTHRGEVIDKLESALKRLRNSSLDKNKDDGSGRKRGGAEGSQDGMHSDAASTMVNGHGRNNHQKRARSSSLSLDGAERGRSYGDLSYSNEMLTDVDAVGADGSSGRGLSREDRKLQQEMKLFAQMEVRERERKKPRIGELSTSPKAGQAIRQKSTKQGVHAPSPSPKSANLNAQDDSDEDMVKMELSRTFGNEGESSDFMLRGQSQKQEHDQTQACLQQADVQEQPQSKQARKDMGCIVPDAEVSRNGPKRERDQKSRDKLEKTLGRRKDSSSLQFSLGMGNGRRKSILDRGRLSDVKKRRTGGGTRESDQKLPYQKEEAKRDPSLNFRLFVVGPSVLGSRLIPMERLSPIHRELRALESAKYATARNVRDFRVNRKEWARAMAMLIAKQNEWKKQSPIRKRFRTADEGRAKVGLDVELEKNGCAQVPVSNRKKAGTVSVSMIVVSEKQNLPDRGQILESSRLIIPSTKNAADRSVLSASRAASKVMCLKKRERLRNVSGNEKVLTWAETKPSEPLQSTHQDVNKSLSSPLTSPHPASIILPENIKSPVLRSTPLHTPTGLRSVSSPTTGTAIRISSPASLPRSTRPSMATKSSSSPPQEPQPLELFRPGPAKFALLAADSNNAAAEKTCRKTSDITGECESAQIPSQSDPILSSKLVPTRSVPPASTPRSMKSSVPSETVKSRSITNGLGLRSIRSVPLSGFKGSAIPVNGTCVPWDKSQEISKPESPLASPHKNERSSSPAVSDIFQQRLKGFLKSKCTSVDEPVSSRNCLKPSSTSPLASKGGASPANVTGTGILRPGNGFQSAVPNSQSKPMEHGSHWRLGMNSKRSLTTYPGVRAITPTGAPVIGNGRDTHLGVSEKPRFRGGRVDGTGRNDENVNNRNGSIGSWNYASKSSWVGGSGRVHKTVNEAVPKTNHREQS